MNNGDLSFTKKDATEHGIRPWEWGSGLQLLEKAGLIVKTKQGQISGGKGVPNLFALTWYPIDPSDKYDTPTIFQRPATHAWAKWKRPDDWNSQVSKSKRVAQGKPSKSKETASDVIARLQANKKSPVHTSEPSQSTRVNREASEPVHPSEPGTANPQSTRVNSFRDLGRGGDGNQRGERSSAVHAACSGGQLG